MNDNTNGVVVTAVRKIERKIEFNEMMFKNQSWKYSAPILSYDDFIHNGYSADEAEYLTLARNVLKDATTKMRRGEFTYGESSERERGVHVEMGYFSYEVDNELLPHWKEFAAALDQFTPAINLLPDSCESSFEIYCYQMNHDALHLVKEALIGKPFKSLRFTNDSNFDDANEAIDPDIILDVVESNKDLRKLNIFTNEIGREHIERLSSTVSNHPSLVQLNLYGSFGPGIGDEMLASLLTIDDLALEKLGMSSNNITSAVSTLLADFLATNPRLKELDLSENNLNVRDAELIFNALRSNTTLRELRIPDNNIKAFRPVLWDNISLNEAADANHVCFISSDCFIPNYRSNIVFSDWNSLEVKQFNRGKKIYKLLSLRNKTMSNTQYFGDIDVKILPNILEAVQKNYYSSFTKYYFWVDPKVDPLSIVYEIMRKWDTAFTLYKSLGLESVEN